MNADEQSAPGVIPEVMELGAIDVKTERREIRSLVHIPRPTYKTGSAASARRCPMAKAPPCTMANSLQAVDPSTLQTKETE